MPTLSPIHRVAALALAGWMSAGLAYAGQATPPQTPPQTQTPPATQTPTTQTPTTGTQTSNPAPATPPATDPQAPPQDLSRIRQALSTEPILKLDDERLRFYLQIIAKQPKFADFVKGYDLMNGPTRRGNPMTHQEFLNMVTPREMISSAGIKPIEMLQFAITNWLGQALIKKALTDLGNARSEREINEIRARIDRELAALTGKGGGSD
jgi:hypothetical protein